MGWGVVKVQKSAPSDCTVGSPSAISSIKTAQHCPEELLIDSLGPLDKLKVDKSPTVKEGEDHHLGCCNGPPGRLRTRLSWSEPLHAVYPFVWIPHIHPGLIHGHNIAEHPWVLMVKSGEEIANVVSSPLVLVCQNCWDKSGTPFL